MIESSKEREARRWDLKAERFWQSDGGRGVRVEVEGELGERERRYGVPSRGEGGGEVMLDRG